VGPQRACGVTFAAISMRVLERDYDRVMPCRSRLTLVGAGIYGAALLLVGLWPTHVDRNIDVVGTAPVQWMIRAFDLSTTEAYNAVEVAANVALFVPLGALAMVWLSRWPRAVLLGFVASAAVEILQELARPGRTASWGDVVANTSGAGLGAAAVLVWRLRARGGS
jgi:glycopeptide antibiotics resistance protein